MYFFLMTLLIIILIFSIGLFIYALFDVYGIWRAAPFVASSKKAVEQMLELAEIKPGTRVLELGSGKGNICIEAARRGAIACGIESNPVLVALARLRAKTYGVHKSVKFIRGNFLRVPFPKETGVVFLYLLSPVMPKVWKKLQSELSPGTMVISNAFQFPDQTPEKQAGNVFRYRL